MKKNMVKGVVQAMCRADESARHITLVKSVVRRLVAQLSCQVDALNISPLLDGL